MDGPKVGVGVWIVKDGKVLVGKRKGKHGQDTWAPPGGHVEFMESLEDAARREVYEETGVKIKNLKLGSFTQDIFKETNKHYITFYMSAEIESGTPQLLEPDKCESWEWLEWNKIPEPLFIPVANLKKTGYDPTRR